MLRYSPILLLLLLSFNSYARKRESFSLDTSLRLNRPLCFSNFRVLPSAYDDAETLWLAWGKKESGSERPFNAQLRDLLRNNVCTHCAPERMSIIVEDVKAYFGDASSVYLRADLFSGPANALHHAGTLDTLIQGFHGVIINPGGKQNFVTICLLQAFSAACARLQEDASRTYTDEEAANFYANKLRQYPLFAQPDVPPMGVFKTVDDFIRLRALDTPLIFEHIAQASGDGYNWFYYKTPEGRKGKRLNPDDFYAASDGKNLYLSFENGRLVKIRKIKNDLVIVLPASIMHASAPNGPFGMGDALSIPLMSGAGARTAADFIGKFSPERKTFVPYGGTLPKP
jgi:hypothetical protein